MPTEITAAAKATRRIQNAARRGAKTLNLSGLKLFEIPSAVGTLAALQTLDLSGNQLSNLPESLGRLTRLRELNCGYNGLTKIPKFISKLRRLEYLDLSYNKITTVPAWICNVSQLRAINLSWNEITALPASLDRLTHLDSLDATSNKLRRLPPTIGRLSKLDDLELSYNRLSSLPASIGRLSHLSALSVAHNKISKLPTTIGGLTSLEWLDLEGNALANLPPTLGRLPELRDLFLVDNQLQTLPQSLLALPALETIYLHGNKHLEIPEEILGPPFSEVARGRLTAPDPHDILAFYFDTRRAAQPLNEVKLVLVGRGAAGKSSIRDRVLFDTFDPQKKETPGIQIDHWETTCGGDPIRVRVWDFAGQEITHATHQFFLTERSIYLLVLDSRADMQDRDAEYWLRLISAFGKDSPIIVALNKWDEKPFDIDRFALRDKFPSIRTFIATDCATRRGIDELTGEIKAVISSLETVREPFPRAWMALKDHFSEMKANYLPFDSFQDECRKRGERDIGRQNRLARILHALGIILHYADDPRLRDTTILNPQWVTESIYKLLRLKHTPQSDGTLSLDEAHAALPKEKPAMVRYLVELMRRFELCFPVDETERRWLVPELLSRFQPELGQEWSGLPALRLRYQYKVLPEGLVPRFITRTYPLSTDQLRWRNGVVLEMDGARALVRNDSAASQVNVTIVGSAHGRQRLAKLIRNHFSQIHADIKGLEPQELVEVEQHPGSYKSVQVLEQDEQKRSVTTVETTSGSVEIDKTRELNRISAPAARDPATQRLRLFLSYSHDDSKMRDTFRINLDLLKADGLIEWWFDGKILPSAEWDKDIRRELEEADIVVCLVSTPFLGSTYIEGVEMKRALERRASGDAAIVSVLLEDCSWKQRPFTRYQMIRPGDKAVRRWPRHRDAFNEVEKRLRDLIRDILSRSGRRRISRRREKTVSSTTS